MPAIIKAVASVLRTLFDVLGTRYCLRIKVYPYTVLLCVLSLYSFLCIHEYFQTESMPQIVTRTLSKEARTVSSTRLSILRNTAEDYLGRKTLRDSRLNHGKDVNQEVDYRKTGKVKYLVMYSGPTAKRPKVDGSASGFNSGGGKHDIYAENFEFFLNYGIHNSSTTVHVDFVLVLTEESLPEWEDRIKAMNMSNVHILLRNPDCYDMQSYIVALHAFDYRQYDRIIGINCGLRGPFVPPYLRHIIPWTAMLGTLIDKDVKLAGLSQNRNGNPFYVSQRHVQSMIWVTDPVGLSVILSAGCMFDCSVEVPGRVMNRGYLIQRYEIGMSVAIKKANYKIRAWNNYQLNKPYCKDHMPVDAPDRKAYPHGPELQDEWSTHGYFATSSPYEIMFVKYTRALRVREKDMDQRKAEKLDECSSEDHERNLESYEDWYSRYVAPIGYYSESKSGE